MIRPSYIRMLTPILKCMRRSPRGTFKMMRIQVERVQIKGGKNSSLFSSVWAEQWTEENPELNGPNFPIFFWKSLVSCASVCPTRIMNTSFMNGWMLITNISSLFNHIHLSIETRCSTQFRRFFLQRSPKLLLRNNYLSNRKETENTFYKFKYRDICKKFSNKLIAYFTGILFKLLIEIIYIRLTNRHYKVIKN